MRRAVVLANWKNSGNLRVVQDFVKQCSKLDKTQLDRLIVFPPAPLLFPLKSALEQANINIRVGAQDCWAHSSNNFNGDTSVEILQDCGADVIICGHGDRRLNHFESDAVVGQKVGAVLNSLRLTRPLHEVPTIQSTPKEGDRLTSCVVCVGETYMAKSMQGASDAITTQLEAVRDQCPPEQDAWRNSRLMVAYEPVWASPRETVPLEHYRQSSRLIRDWLAQRVFFAQPATAEKFPILCAGVGSTEFHLEILTDILS